MTADRTARIAVSLIVVALILRVAHLAYMLGAPTMFQLGADEAFYLQYAQTLLAGGDVVTAEYAFMDPLYGYLLAGVFAVLGENLPAVLAIQVLIDAATGFFVWRIAVELDRPRAGLIALALYALCATAIFYSCTLLRETWVACAVVVWTWAALRLARTPRALAALAFGLFCGLAVALRSNLVLLGVAALVLLPIATAQAVGARRAALVGVALGAGLALSLGLLATRNAAVSGVWSPFPTNGGAVLHHIYNAQNPGGYSVFPSFVAYANPTDMQRGYQLEAERRNGRAMTSHEAGAYWSAQAREFALAHPAQVASDVWRKAGEFVAWPEVGNNRSFATDRQFSPVLAWLPSPFGGLIALGLPGLMLAALRDRRALWLWVVPLTAFATFVVFYAESRFRFVAVPILALGAAFALDACLAALRERRYRVVLALALPAALLGALSVILGAAAPPPANDWRRLAWGYLKMGAIERARDAVLAAPADAAGDVEELLGYMALLQGDPARAAAHYRAAIAAQSGLRHVVYFNLAIALGRTGDWHEAAAQARRAAQLSPLPEYVELAHDLESVAGERPLAEPHAVAARLKKRGIDLR